MEPNTWPNGLHHHQRLSTPTHYFAEWDKLDKKDKLAMWRALRLI